MNIRSYKNSWLGSKIRSGWDYGLWW